MKAITYPKTARVLRRLVSIEGYRPNAFDLLFHHGPEIRDAIVRDVVHDVVFVDRILRELGYEIAESAVRRSK